MIVDTRRYDRHKLNEQQKDFLRSLISFMQLTQEHTKNKSKIIRLDSPYGIFASVAAAECILKSDWGTSLIVDKANNLFFIEKEEGTKGKGFEYKGLILGWRRTFQTY